MFRVELAAAGNELRSFQPLVPFLLIPIPIAYKTTGGSADPQMKKSEYSREMGEVVTVHVGQCGNSVAASFWETIVAEHGKECENCPALFLR